MSQRTTFNTDDFNTDNTKNNEDDSDSLLFYRAYAFSVLGKKPIQESEDLERSQSESDEEDNEQGKLELQAEQKRVAEFNLHLALIDKGYHSYFDYLEFQIKVLPILRDPIPRFSQSDSQGLPTLYLSRGVEARLSLFDIILTNPNLSANQQCQLISELFEHGYYAYFDMVLNSHDYSHWLSKSEAHPAVKQYYLWSLTHCADDQLQTIEAIIWRKFFDVAQGNLLFEILLSHAAINAKPLYRFVNNTLNFCQNTENVYELYERLDSIIKNINITAFTSTIMKMAKMKIISFLFEGIETTPLYKMIEPLSPAENLLGSHRYYYFFGRWGKTNSLYIYEYLKQGNITEARKLYDLEMNALHSSTQITVTFKSRNNQIVSEEQGQEQEKTSSLRHS